MGGREALQHEAGRALSGLAGMTLTGTVCPRIIYYYSPGVRLEVQTLVAFTNSFCTSYKLWHFLTHCLLSNGKEFCHEQLLEQPKLRLHEIKHEQMVWNINIYLAFIHFIIKMLASP